MYPANSIINFAKLAKKLGLVDCEVYSCLGYNLSGGKNCQVFTVGKNDCQVEMVLGLPEDSEVDIPFWRKYPTTFISDYANSKVKDYPESIIKLEEYELVDNLPIFDILYNHESLEDVIDSSNKIVAEQIIIAGQLKNAKYGNYCFNKNCTLAFEWSSVYSDLYLDEETVNTYLFLLRSGFDISLYQYSDYVCIEATKENTSVSWTSRKTREELQQEYYLVTLKKYLQNEYENILPFGRVEFDFTLLDNLKVSLDKIEVVNFKKHYRLITSNFDIIVMKKIEV